ncbi:hypothetical protein [Streptosporangium jomthongense]|uniref:Secreted protein n=1 Tax=Streptosporangium jomthongense TaxID=1193683 RepID=A0ABV8EWQ0_9ACTN
MRSIAGLGAVVVLVTGASVPFQIIPTVSAEAMGGMTLTLTANPGTSPTPSPSPSASWNPSKLPAAWKNITSLRILPAWPRQRNDVRLMVHCPTGANHATVGSTAFALRASRHPYREIGLGLSDRGIGRDAVSISYYAPLGPHMVRLRCVKVKIDHETRIRRIRLISRVAAPVFVRRFNIAQFFACVPVKPC